MTLENTNSQENIKPELQSEEIYEYHKRLIEINKVLADNQESFNDRIKLLTEALRLLEQLPPEEAKTAFLRAYYSTLKNKES